MDDLDAPLSGLEPNGSPDFLEGCLNDRFKSGPRLIIDFKTVDALVPQLIGQGLGESELRGVSHVCPAFKPGKQFTQCLIPKLA